jgi:glycosyltransferase involved in cell wall biosynthesis
MAASTRDVELRSPQEAWSEDTCPFQLDGSRILMVNKFLYSRGGAEQYMLQLAALLQNEGAACSFFGMDHPENPSGAARQAMIPHVDLENPPNGPARLALAGRMIYSPRARRRMRSFVARDRHDLAHVHNIYHQLSPAVLAPLHQRMPVVMTVHDYKLVCPVYTLMSNGEVCERCIEAGSFMPAFTHRCNRGSASGSALVALETAIHHKLGLYKAGVDIFVAPSEFLRKQLVRGGYPPERVVTIPNFPEVAEAPGNLRGGAFLYVGRLSSEKGVDVLLKAAAGTQLEVRIAGEGPARAELESLADDLRVSATFLGHVDRTQVAVEMAGSRAVVLPARWHENCPLSVIEAMWSGTPVIASNLGGIPELIRDRVDGLVIPHDDPAALKEAMTTMTASVARTLGEQARERARNRFSARRHLSRIADAYALAAAVREERRRS